MSRELRERYGLSLRCLEAAVIELTLKVFSHIFAPQRAPKHIPVPVHELVAGCSSLCSYTALRMCACRLDSASIQPGDCLTVMPTNALNDDPVDLQT
eukprot:6468922-Amphidinium_carterae.2